MEKQKPRAAPPPEVVERDVVRVATNRCPFCHDDVAVEGNDWVSCRSCQARHHVACWDEGGCCSACGAEGRLVPDLGVAPLGAELQVDDPNALHMRFAARWVWQVGDHTVVAEMSYWNGREAV